MDKAGPELLRGESHRFALAVSRFNEFITARLAEGARATLLENGVRAENIVQVWVPGAWELPIAALKLAQAARPAAVLGLGCVIRGQTPHFDFVAGQCAAGLQQVALATGVPTVLGVLTVDSVPQALDRVGGRHGHKGVEAALAALEMANVLGTISGGKG